MWHMQEGEGHLMWVVAGEAKLVPGGDPGVVGWARTRYRRCSSPVNSAHHPEEEVGMSILHPGQRTDPLSTEGTGGRLLPVGSTCHRAVHAEAGVEVVVEGQGGNCRSDTGRVEGKVLRYAGKEEACWGVEGRSDAGERNMGGLLPLVTPWEPCRDRCRLRWWLCNSLLPAWAHSLAGSL